MVQSDVELTALESTEIRSKLFKRGRDGQGRQTILNSGPCFQQNPYSLGISAILNQGKSYGALTSSMERA
jgi:hypothetical protein